MSWFASDRNARAERIDDIADETCRQMTARIVEEAGLNPDLDETAFVELYDRAILELQQLVKKAMREALRRAADEGITIG
jgi:hypothetical protein